MNGLFGGDLPTPNGRDLLLYLLGPGVGESQVVVFPDGGTVVVDSCRIGTDNLTLALLGHLGIASVDLLVLTHPDLDHIRGFADLVRGCAPKQIWRYPCATSVRDFAAGLLRRTPNEKRLVDVHDALVAIDEHLERFGEPTEAYLDRMWERPGYEVRCIAPTPYDVERANGLVKHCVSYMVGARPRVSRRFERFLQSATGLGDVPNVLSVALAVRWGDVRLLLCGDVTNGSAKPFSGWKGVLRLLDKPERSRSYLVESVAGVKVAHHGSRGAFHPPTWGRHAKQDGATVAMLTPFKTTLPEVSVVRDLATHCSRLGVSELTEVAKQHASAGGWTPAAASALAGTAAPCVAARFLADGSATLYSGGGGCVLDRAT